MTVGLMDENRFRIKGYDKRMIQGIFHISGFTEDVDYDRNIGFRRSAEFALRVFQQPGSQFMRT